nr:ISAs1 family transposase [Sporolactobacillus pectinivorans]
MALTATICAIDSFTDMEEFGYARKEWFESFLELPNGIPSHDTFARVFSLLDPETVERCFMNWTADVYTLTEGEIVAIDGKTLRGSHHRAANKRAIHTLCAWATEQKAVLARRKVEGKTNEITVIPELLDLLKLKGCIVTIDAMGCQKDIAAKIREKEADYVLALKGNQSTLHEDVRLYLEDAQKNAFKDVPHSFYKQVEKGHGRVDVRRYWTTDAIDFLDQKEEWKGLKSVGVVESERQTGDQVSVERRFYLSSLSSDAKTFAKAVRQHWQIENGLHHVLDVTFREDEQRMRLKNSAQNMALLRRCVVNLLKQETTSKRSIRGKRLKAGFDFPYLKTVLALAYRLSDRS